MTSSLCHCARRTRVVSLTQPCSQRRARPPRACGDRTKRQRVRSPGHAGRTCAFCRDFSPAPNKVPTERAESWSFGRDSRTAWSPVANPVARRRAVATTGSESDRLAVSTQYESISGCGRCDSSRRARWRSPHARAVTCGSTAVRRNHPRPFGLAIASRPGSANVTVWSRSSV